MDFGDLPLSPNIPELFAFSGLATRGLLLEIAPLTNLKINLQGCRTLTSTKRHCQAIHPQII